MKRGRGNWQWMNAWGQPFFREQWMKKGKMVDEGKRELMREGRVLPIVNNYNLM
jgi:hypothetical protein